VTEIVAHHSDGLLRLIGAFKMLKVLLLLAAGFGIFGFGDHAPQALAWHFDAQSHYVNGVLAKISHTSPKQLHEVGIGCFVYAAMFATEGIGLLMRKVWAEYVTIIITGSFIPLEIYEMVEHKSILKGIVIVLNIAIVIYLVLRLRRDKHWPFR